mgnify:CR=1 FL=1
MRRVILCGTFDTLHYGYIRLVRRARELGNHLILSSLAKAGTANSTSSKGSVN